MQHLDFKKMNSVTFIRRLLLVLIVLVVSVNLNFTYALNCPTYSNPNSWSFSGILCPVVQIINIMLFTSGSVFIVMILVGAYKYAVSVGDVKAVDGAKQTLTYAVFGFFAVVGVYTLLYVLGNAFGFNSDYVGANVFDTAQCAICDFFQNNDIITNMPNCGGC